MVPTEDRAVRRLRRNNPVLGKDFSGGGQATGDQGGLETVQRSVLEAIRDGDWNYEPTDLGETDYSATGAMPGSVEKLSVLAIRAERGLPLWHNSDRLTYDESRAADD